MGNIFRILKDLRRRGLAEIFSIVSYCVRRDVLDLRYHWDRFKPSVPQEPGTLLNFSPERTGGRFRFQRAMLKVCFLSQDLVFVEWATEESGLTGSELQRKWAGFPVSIRNTGDILSFETPDCSLEVSAEGELRWSANGKLLRGEEPPIRKGPTWTHRSRLQPFEHVHGLGEQASPLVLNPGRYTMWNTDPGGHYGPSTQPIYSPMPVFLGRITNQQSYMVFFENSHRSEFRFSRTSASIRFSGGRLRFFFIPGPPCRAVSRYTELTGRPQLPPRWALRFHQSRWSYKSSEEIRELVRGFQDHDLPLGAVHLDIDYMDGYRVFTVDRKRFPDLEELSRELTTLGIRLVTILDPGVKKDVRYSAYQSGMQNQAFCTDPSGKPVTARVWPGWCVFPDFTSSRVRRWWGEQYAGLLNSGIAGFWHDMNEPSIFVAWGDPSLPRAVRHDMDGKESTHAEAHNRYGMDMARAGYEGVAKLRPSIRPWLLTRAGWAGVQQYAWIWTGDVQSTWQGLQQTVPLILNLGLSGCPFTGCDVGGFSGSPTPELFIRWLQTGTFLPFFRTHSAWYTDRREPWSYGEPYTSIARDYLVLRTRLLPYLYTLAWTASRTGHPMVRPLFWAHGDRKNLSSVQDQFLLGDELLIAPVLRPGVASRDVVLPPGTWYPFDEDRSYPGGSTQHLPSPLHRIPVLVRGGAILPLGENNRIVLHICPDDAGNASGQLYSDAGDGFGPFRIDRFRLTRCDRGYRLERESEGAYPFPAARITVRMCSSELSQAQGPDFSMPILENRVNLPVFNSVLLR